LIPAPPPDPRLPGISAAWDGIAIAAILNRGLPEETVRSCEPCYVKYKPERYCRIQYQVELENQDGDTLRTPAHVSLYPAKRAEKLAKQNRLPQGEGPHSRRRANYIPELAAIVQVFPVDLALPGLSDAISAEAMARRIHQGLGERAGGSLEGCEVELVRYKAEKRAVLRYELRGTRIRAVYGKLRSDRGDAISRIAGTLARAGVATPEPLGYLADLNMLLQSEGTGVRLADLRSTAEYASWMPAVVDALVQLHTSEIADLPRPSDSNEVAELQSAADIVAVLLPHLGLAAASLAHRLTARLSTIKGDLAPTHGSFHDDQVLVGHNSVALIDLDGAKMASPLSDVGHFLSYLSANGTPDAYERFLTSYGSALPGEVDDYLVFEAASLLRWAALPFRELRPDWPQAVERRVELACERLRAA
jgi:aminoglycoside phosphotransferase (APT) family kinase protein